MIAEEKERHNMKKQYESTTKVMESTKAITMDLLKFFEGCVPYLMISKS